MTDRELLEAAARALPERPESADWLLYPEGSAPMGLRWNPLEDDGDALRLAVRLDIVPRVINGVAFAWRDGVCDMQEPCGSDPYAGTRRAIVRAAAEIGKGMA